MKDEDYLKQKLKEGKKVPEEIHPYRNGLVNIEQLKSIKPVIKDLIKQGETCIIKSDDKGFQNEMTTLLASQLILGQNQFSDFWQVPSKNSRKCLILTDSSNSSVLLKGMLEDGLKDFCAAESDGFFTQKNDWSTLINDQRPSVCLIALETKSLRHEHLKALEKLVLINKRKAVTTILVDYKPKWISPAFDVEVTIHSNKDERFLAVTNLHTSIIEYSFSLSKNQKPYSTRALTQKEQKEIFDREKKQAKPAVAESFSKEDL